jgi:rhodanese-related sulfurtransferase
MKYTIRRCPRVIGIAVLRGDSIVVAFRNQGVDSSAMFSQQTLRGVLVLVLVGIGLGIGYNLASPTKVPWKAKERKAQTLEATPFLQEEATPVVETPSEPEPSNAPLTDPGTAGSSPAQVAEQNPSPAASENSETPADLYADIPESEFPREISLAQAKAFYDRGGLMVLDSREAEDYAMGHIKDAVHAPHDERVGDVEWLDSMAAKPEPFLIYCDGGTCELSLNLGFAICESGHRKVLILKDGYPAWEDAGYPTSTGNLP